MTQAINAIREKSENNMKTIVFSLFILMIALFASYVYCINYSVANGANKKSFEKNINQVNLSLVELETEYYSIKNSINEEVAVEKGFILNKNPNFIQNKTVGQVSMSTNEI